MSWLLKRLQDVLPGRLVDTFNPKTFETKIHVVNMGNLSPNQVETRNQQLEITNKVETPVIFGSFLFTGKKWWELCFFLHLPIYFWKNPWEYTPPKV